MISRSPIEGLSFDCSAESLRGLRMLNLRTPKSRRAPNSPGYP